MGSIERVSLIVQADHARWSGAWPLALAFALVALAPRAALAQQDPLEARYEQGVALRGQHRDADALVLFRAIYAETHAPRALAQMGLAEAALGQWSEAEGHLSEALGAATDPWVQRNRAVLDGAQRTIRDHLGSLEVTSPTAGAEVWVQGRRVASLPMAQPARVVAGTVTFEVRAPGHVTVMRVATVAPNGFARESVELTAAAAAASTPSTTPTAPTAPVPPTVAPEVARPGSTQRTLGWVAAASAGVFLVGGTVAYVLGLGKVSEYDAACPPPDTPNLSSDCASRVSGVGTLEAVAITGFVGGGVFAAASAVMLLTAPSGRASATAGLACGRGPGDVGVTCRFAF